MADFIPTTDIEYDDWLNNFNTFIQASGAFLGLTPAQLAELQDATATWHTAFVAHNTVKTSAKSARQIKVNNRSSSQTLARKLVRLIQASPQMNDGQRAAARITVPDQSSVSSSEDLVEITPPPIVLLDWSIRSKMIVHYGQNPSNERNNGLPPGMKGCKIFYALGAVPETEAGWTWLADHTRSPYIHVLPIEVPTLVVYRVQYFDRKFRVGSFSEVADAMVTV